MPFLSQDDEELKKQQGPQAISGQSTVLNAPQAAQKPGAPASSGQFKNLQTYLDANKEQAQQMGQQVVGSAEQSAQEAQQNIKSYEGAAPGTVKQYDAGQLESEFYKNPNATTEQYQTLKSTGGYTGPKSASEVSGYQQAQESTKAAKEKIGQLGTQSGVEQAAAQQFARPGYSAGAQRLDATLLRRNPDIAGQAAQLQQDWGGLENMLNQANTSVEQRTKSASDVAFVNKQLLPQVEQKYVENLYSGYQQRANEKNLSNQELINRVQEDLKDNILSAETLSLMGLSPNTSTYGLNLGDYLQTNNTQLQANDVLNAQEREDWKNLMNLIGSSDNRLSQNGLTVNPASFDIERYKSDLKSMEPVAQQKLSDIMGRWGKNRARPSSGGFTYEGDINASFEDMLSKGMGPDEYNQWLKKQSLAGRTGYDSYSDSELSQLKNDYNEYLKLNKKIKREGENLIDNSIGRVTGGLKG